MVLAGVRVVDTRDDDELIYRNAGPRGRAESARLPILRGTFEGGAIDTLIVASDLQGMLRHALLGVRVAEHLEPHVDPERTGVILAGDLYCVPTLDKRGGFGPVHDVWRAFAERFAWTCGVAGNHDDMTGVAQLSRVDVLDGEVVERGGLRIGGVGGIISAKQKPGRRSEREQVARIERVIDACPDILVLHEGPHGGDAQPGNDLVRELVDATTIPLVICGHDHWREPLAQRELGQILNVDARVVVLQRVASF